MMWTRRTFVALLFPAMMGGQTLVHPGWRGNGIAPEAWWKHAAFIRFDEATTFAQAAAAMDSMSEAGADTLILPDFSPRPADSVVQPFDTRFGTEDELDALLREASARRMHVLLRTDLLRLAGNPGELRFWMSRGIGGFDVGEVPSAQVDTLRLLRGAMDRFPGRRILLARVSIAVSNDPVTLHLVSMQTASTQAGTAHSAVEIHSAEALKTLPPPGATLVVDASLLASEQLREDLRHAVAARGMHVRTYSRGRSTRHRSG